MKNNNCARLLPRFAAAVALIASIPPAVMIDASVLREALAE